MYNNNVDVVRLLLEHRDIDVNIKNDDGYTALMIAIIEGHLEVAEALIDHSGTKFEIQDKQENTALVMASSRDLVSLVEKILTKLNLITNNRNRVGAPGSSNDVTKALDTTTDQRIQQMLEDAMSVFNGVISFYK